MMKFRLLAVFILGIVLLTLLPASAYLINSDGPEPIILQVEQSLRLSQDLDSALADLAATENQLGLTVVTRYVGTIFLELVNFPSDFTEDQVWAAITRLSAERAVARITPASQAWIYQPSDFGTAYGPTDTIPEAVLRGLATPSPEPFDPASLIPPHIKGEFLVTWKPEFVWNASQTGFLEQMAQFNAEHGCTVAGTLFSSETELTQLLRFKGGDQRLAEILSDYIASGWVESVEPNYILGLGGGPASSPHPAPGKSHRRNHDFVIGLEHRKCPP